MNSPSPGTGTIHLSPIEEEPSVPSEADYRLPRTVIPSHYELKLTPDLGDASFAGNVLVDVAVVEPVSEIVVNAAELTLYDVTLFNSDGQRLASTVETDEKAERSTLHLDGIAAPGAWKLGISFDGILNDDLRGFYRSVYTDPNGVEKTIATTQFEATEARRAFPCWDEPDLKATYGVTLIVDDGLTAISNGAEAERTDVGGGKVAVRFADTIKMSTYLVAFIIGELEATDPIDVDGNLLRIVSPAGEGKTHRLRTRCCRSLPQVLRRVLRHPIPRRKDGQDCHPRFRVGCDGEHGGGDVPRDGAAGRSSHGHPDRDDASRRGDRP